MYEYVIVGAGSAGCAPAVVDERLRGHGIEGLRVVDASIMPCISSGNTNATTIMIGGNVSDLILGNPSLAPSNVHPLHAA